MQDVGDRPMTGKAFYHAAPNPGCMGDLLKDDGEDIAGEAERVTLVTVHAFMDRSNFDVERASKCCVTEVLPDGRMVPFCVYNNLHRPAAGHGGC